jgi:bifunctional UDP-N-acetylglucosamine pyrophosphorylase/glucosamine-1-phosphate N-acetyltransferase
MKDLRTIILAAGKGTRMKSDIPKVLHKVCGVPIIDYVLNITKSIGSLKTFVVLGHKSQLVEQHLSEKYKVIHQPKLLGTGDAVKVTEQEFKGYNGSVLILCGDTPLLNKHVIRSIIRRHKKMKAAVTFLTAVVHDPSGYGRVIRDDKGHAVAIREDKDAVGFERNISEINVGVYCFRSKELFAELKEIKLNSLKKEFYLTDIIEIFHDKKLKIETVETDDPREGLGVNTRLDLAYAEKIIRERILNEWMLNGVTIVDPKNTYIHSQAKIGRDTVIHPFTFIEANVVVGRNCQLGPFARLRSGVRLGDAVTIGNFTEVSRTKIGNKSIMKHFSYLGDARVGAQVNIGAGTITANYDGESKNVTHIGDRAFIGCDSVLIAPVKIGRKAVVGAGSVVTKKKNVPAEGVVVGVPAKMVSRRHK